jgi:hypothetical protein
MRTGRLNNTVDAGLMTLLYNLLMLVADGAALFHVRQQRRPGAAVFALSITGLLAVLVAVALGEDNFGRLRLLAWGIFGHGAVMFVGCGGLLWQAARGWAVLGFLAAAAVEAVAVDAFLIEPTWLEVSHVRLTSRKLKAPLSIAVVADLQTDVIGPYERDVLRRVLDARPDVILLAGDYLHVQDDEPLLELSRQLNDLLAEMNFYAPLGVYAVGGNVDAPNWPTIFYRLPVTTFASTGAVDLPRGDVRITGLTLNDSFNRSLTVPASDRFHICLGHGPDFAMSENVSADLLVAGHTHGGQVKIPLIGPIVTLSRVPRLWAGGGLTELPGNRKLVVSRGIGMERINAPRLRFLCRPELVFIRVEPE